ncbi:BURP domain-containing protein 9-like [Prosopis cineraria]|uniref:BURP domain-containing protein 9-like n=1 Tax=Prosopis cineraria TaxID=364024 RepID=UPI00240FD4CE|nr:BURP domain-containing protein 9-like [Prosopis cineraria]
MAPSLNTKTLSLCSLFSLLLFLHVHGNNAREMKAEEELPKQNEASPDDSYTPPYKAAYATTTTIHHHHQPYQAGYTHSQKDLKQTGKPYITAYGGTKRGNHPYIAGYINGRKENKPAGYINNQKMNQPYIAGYINGGYIHGKRENQPGYIDNKKMNQPYIAGYINGGYISGKRENHHHGYIDNKKMNQPYIAGYINGGYINGKKMNHDTEKMNQHYVTAYGGDKKDSEEKNSEESYAVAYAKDSKDSYAMTYRKTESENADAATTKGDHTELFKKGFFSLDDLYVGNRMTLQFPIEEFPHFLTKKEADSIPFSTSQLPSVLQLLSVSQDSPEAQSMRDTLEQCELQPLTAETKVCVSSLESMIDFVRSIMGSDSQLDILTTTLPAASSVPLQNLTVLEISPDIYAPKWVACHPLPYHYAVFYCHFIDSGSKIFRVRLRSESGEQMEALGMCHLDTSEWSPDLIFLQQMGIKPGEAPVCHFFPVKHLMWVPLPSKAAM